MWPPPCRFIWVTHGLSEMIQRDLSVTCCKLRLFCWSWLSLPHPKLWLCFCFHDQTHGWEAMQGREEFIWLSIPVTVHHFGEVKVDVWSKYRPVWSSREINAWKALAAHFPTPRGTLVGTASLLTRIARMPTPPPRLRRGHWIQLPLQDWSWFDQWETTRQQASRGVWAKSLKFKPEATSPFLERIILGALHNGARL